VRVAIVHDFLTQRGGAERVVLAMHRMFPEAPIFTSLYDADSTFADFGEADVRTSFLQRLPHSGNRFRAYLPVYPFVFGRMKLDGYDLVLSSSSHFAHTVRTDAYHINYCHTPARWLYDTGRYLTDGGPVPGWGRTLVAPVLAAIRRWDRHAAWRPDVTVANSKGIAFKIRRFYGRTAEVIYPPVDVERFPTSGRGWSTQTPAEPAYLTVARLLPYKRIDLAVRACTERGARLVVVGEGPALQTLRSIAGPTVTFAGRVPEAELIRLYTSSRALIQCGEEDFGIALLEANAAGRPVVAYSAGGALETVVDGETGVLHRSQTTESLHGALDRIESQTWSPAPLRRHASRFGEARFQHELRSLIATNLGVSAA
jgi:glycosyltransferase involved in cell wall biosynthesis